MTTDIPRTIAVWAEGTNAAGDLIMGADTPSGLPWPHDAADLKHFREATRGHTLIMGRTTFEKLPAILKSRTSLAERPIIVLTRTAPSMNWAYPGLPIQPYSVDDSMEAGRLLYHIKHSELWTEFNNPVAVIGGAKVIELFEPFYSELVVTTMLDKRHEGNVPAPSDAFFDNFTQSALGYLLDSGARVNRLTHRTKEN